MFSKFEKFVFLALVFSIPFQKRFFLFGPSPQGEGFFEWGSGFLYFTDILIVVLAVFWLKSIYPKLNFGQRYKVGFGSAFVWFIFLVFAFASLAQAALVDVAVYRFIKLAEFTFLFFLCSIVRKNYWYKINFRSLCRKWSVSIHSCDSAVCKTIVARARDFS